MCPKAQDCIFEHWSYSIHFLYTSDQLNSDSACDRVSETRIQRQNQHWQSNIESKPYWTQVNKIACDRRLAPPRGECGLDNKVNSHKILASQQIVRTACIDANFATGSLGSTCMHIESIRVTIKNPTQKSPICHHLLQKRESIRHPRHTTRCRAKKSAPSSVTLSCQSDQSATTRLLDRFWQVRKSCLL